MKLNPPYSQKYDLICVGGGIMSATLALMLKLLNRDAKILIFERLEDVARESSAALNNAGTGHSGFCELNYTPENEDGKVDVSKALGVCNQFERTKSLLRYLVNRDMIHDLSSMVQPVPHCSWVRGERQVSFLKKRFDALMQHKAFEKMEFTDDVATMKEWFPLIFDQREVREPMAATRHEDGTELNFGQITRTFFDILKNHFDTPVHTQHEVKDIDPQRNNDWLVEVKNLKNGDKIGFDAHHVFIGAGGWALPLLQKVEIEEKDQYGGFPVSGQWLICKNRDVVEQHHAKVYSKGGVNAPPMAMPHLDTRFVDGEKALIFGPFAGFSTKFLKEGSYTDLPQSIHFKNLPAYWGAFWHNLDLTKYLLEEVTKTHEDRMKDLRDFIPSARSDDWELKVAGQRVQVIKKDEEKGGDVEFGTDIVHSRDGSITALLGASPGASTVVHIMLNVLKIAFPERMDSEKWQTALSEMIPFWNGDITKNDEALARQREAFRKMLRSAVKNHTD